ncbi:MAG: D-alanyl-D-alanine carboxypeptidase family protein [Phyllobacterium sp.]
MLASAASRAFRPFAFAISMLAILAGCSTTSTPDIALHVTKPEKHAAIVINAYSGEVLFEQSSEALRYPASLTKMMTLYIMFEALDAGKITKSTMIPVSSYAASRPPSKIGFKPGQAIDVDSAIQALVTKSANDVASAVAEYFAGSEEAFAQVMTSRARQLGMSRTTFRNASGLPDPAQQTTARDMARLGLALRKHFPHHYHYFSTKSFSFAGKNIKGHNRVLDRVEGADGIKTGYTRASGFNIATSVNTPNRRLIAVVMGGDTAKARDAQVTQLIERYINQASGN